MQRSMVAVSDEYLRIRPDQLRIEMRQQLRRTPSAARADNSIDLRIGERRMQIGNALLRRPRIVERPALQRMRHPAPSGNPSLCSRSIPACTSSAFAALAGETTASVAPARSAAGFNHRLAGPCSKRLALADDLRRPRQQHRRIIRRPHRPLRPALGNRRQLTRSPAQRHRRRR